MEKINHKNIILRLFTLVISLTMSALLYNTLLLPLSLVTGGSNGIATITYRLYYIEPFIMFMAISIACAFISLMYLGTEKTSVSILGAILYPILVKITAPLASKIVIDTSDVLLVVLFAGVISGIANGLMYKTGFNSGGLQSISQILYEKKKIAISKTSLIMNVTIVLIGSIFFGLTNALYAILFLYINSLVLDKVLLGISTNKAFYIITDKDDKVKEYIIEKMSHTVTVFDVKGGFLKTNKKVILTVIPSREYYKVTEGIKKIDKEAFFVVTDAYQVKGAK